jgi:glycosyltransferase involved in cell wall biosynthesis
LTQALLALLQDAELRERLGDAGRQTVLQGFTLAHQAEQLARLYRRCVE